MRTWTQVIFTVFSLCETAPSCIRKAAAKTTKEPIEQWPSIREKKTLNLSKKTNKQKKKHNTERELNKNVLQNVSGSLCKSKQITMNTASDEFTWYFKELYLQLCISFKQSYRFNSFLLTNSNSFSSFWDFRSSPCAYPLRISWYLV